MDTNKKYFESLLKNSKSNKKQIALYLDEEKIEEIDLIIKLFSSISDSKSFSRNMLIEEAIDKFIVDSKKFLLDDQGTDVDELLEEKRKKYDTVILSSKGRGFEDTFLGESEEPCWYPCKISETREKNLKYIAIYRGAPVSAITHYAKIKEFKYSEERGCKVCYFDGKAKALPNKIKLGTKNNRFFVGAKYTALENLINASIADEIDFI